MNALDSLALPLEIRARLRRDYAPHSEKLYAPCPGEDAGDVASAVDAGAWSVFPIFSGPDRLVGPLLTPDGCRYDDHWCLTYRGGTIAYCHGATRFPDRQCASRTQRARTVWLAWRNNWRTVEGPRWRTLCAILGTTDPVYEGLLFDDAWLPDADEEADPERSLARACDLLCAVDPHPDTRAYCAALLGPPPQGDVPACGIWTERLRFAWIDRLEETSGRELPVALAAARHALGRDSGCVRSQAFLLGNFSGSGMPGALGTPASRLRIAFKDDAPEVQHPLVQAFRTYGGMSYDGRAHLLAAAQLDLAGDPRSAWVALESAAFAMRYTPAALTCFQAALSLAERNQFRVAPILRQMWELYLQARPDADRSPLAG